MKCDIYIDFYYDIDEPGRHEMTLRNFDIINGEVTVSGQGIYVMSINYFPIWYEDPMKTDIESITHLYLFCESNDTRLFCDAYDTRLSETNEFRFLMCMPNLEYVHIELEEVYYSHMERSQDETEMIISEIKKFLPEGCIVEIV